MGMPTIHSHAERSLALDLSDYFHYESIKYSLDGICAVALLLLAAPMMLAIALAIRLTSRGPVIYTQPRLTKGGKTFIMFKFRSMYVDAENSSGPVWARRGDPRITPIGRFLRVARLDELPQLLNVVLGQMSLIGPRPERPELAAELSKNIPQFKRRMEVRAGITGLAQVANGYASEVNGYRRKVKFDVHYVNHFSLALDIAIALRTIRVVLTGFGAR